jgi:lysozyme
MKPKRSMTRRAAPWAAAGVVFVGAWEGLQLVSYRDVVGVATICYGETRGVKMGMKATKAECDAMLAEGLLEFADGIAHCVPWDDMPDTRKVAAVSLAYNIGQGGFCKSSVARELRNGNVNAACDAFLRFNKAGGVVWRGLTNRRKAERELCLR